MDVITHHSSASASSSSSSYSSYSCSIPNISRTASSATLPPRWSERTKSTSSHINSLSSRSAAPPLASLSRSASSLPLHGKSKTPITNLVLKIAAGMDDPKARNIAYLVEDAKLLHQKLTALETDGVDLEKIGLFSPVTLASFTPPPAQKRPRGIAYENTYQTKKERQRRASLMAPPSSISTQSNSRKASSMPRSSNSSVSSPGLDNAKSKSHRRNIFSSFGRAKGKRSSEVLSNSLNEPRHSVSSLVLNRLEVPEKAGSLNHLVGAGVTSLFQDGTLINRSSSLDIINFSSVPATSPSRSGLSSSHRSSPKSVALQTSREGGVSQNSGLSSSHQISQRSSTLTSHQTCKSLKSRARQNSVDGILEANDTTHLTPRSSLSVSDYGSYPATSATPPLRPRQLGSKPITRHSSADGILQDTDSSPSLQRFSEGGSSMSSQSMGSQENLVNDTWTPLSASSSPSSPRSQGPFLKATLPRNEGDPERRRTARSATCSPGLERAGNSSNSPRCRQRKISAGSPVGTTFGQPDLVNSGGSAKRAGRYLGEHSSSLPPTPQHMYKQPVSRESLSSRDLLSVGSSQPNSLHSSQDSISAQRSNGKPPSSSVNSRVTVATLVDELTEVEKQVRGSVDEDAFNSSEHSQKSNSEGMSKRSQITASSATLELDQLMQNLEDFEPPSPAPNDQDSSVSKKPKSAMDDLSNMLGSLEMDMENIHGVSTVAKGMCAACKKPILAKVLDALGRQWHPEHFTCTSCDVELANITYYENNGRPYCEKDFHEMFAPRCAYCNGPILERVMRALDKTWHPEHFFCTMCGKNFGSDGFHEKDNKAFCRECYYEKYAPRCRRCSKAIMEGFITALNAQWHPECFSCKVCGITFPRGNYFEHDGEPHCELHYHASRGTLCASCQKPVTGKCVTAMGRKWHPEHFTCAFCLKLLNKGTFKEHRHNPYCQTCYIKLFG